MKDTQQLFGEFTPISDQEWLDKVTKDLRGKDFDQTLKTTTEDDIVISPYYRATEQSTNDFGSNLQPGWLIRSSIIVTDEKEANRSALSLLEQGVESLQFFIQEDTNLEALLKDIYIDALPLHFSVVGDSANAIQQYADLADKRGLNKSDLTGGWTIDPIGQWVHTGNWAAGESGGMEQMRSNAEMLKSLLPGMKRISIEGTHYLNAGASSVQQLAAILAHANEYLNRGHAQGYVIDELVDAMEIRLAIGTDYFTEIAKLMAFRQLWITMSKGYGSESSRLPAIHGENARYNFSVQDPNVNILRSTTACMSAVIGGCDSISVLPYDIAFKLTNSFSDRISKNIQLILKHESHFDKVGNPASGAYAIEALSHELAQKAWVLFKDIEQRGGLMACMESNWLQDEISRNAMRNQAAMASQQIVMVGVNKYVNQNEVVAEPIRPIGNSEDRAIQPLPAIRLAAETESTAVSS